MHNLHVEYHSHTGSISKSLAEQIYSKPGHGKVAVVAEKPAVLMGSTRKQLLKLIRRSRRERSSTLNALKIARLTEQVAWAQSLHFSAKNSEYTEWVDVIFATAESFVQFPPMHPTVYVTYEFDKEKLHMLTSWMPKNGSVVIYGQK